MGRRKPKQILGSSSSIKRKQVISSSKLVALGVLESLVGIAYLCTKHASRASRKLQETCSKRLRCSKPGKNGGDDDGPLWQRTILMGGKCQPLDFSGVIYYDSDGNRMHKLPIKSAYAARLDGSFMSSNLYKNYYYDA